MVSDEILNKLLKVKKLAEKGSEGEKQNAQKLLDRMMKQYNITEEDLEQDIIYAHGYIVNEEYEKRLFVQVTANVRKDIAVAFLGDVKLKDKDSLMQFLKSRGWEKSNCLLDCTDSEFIEIVTKYEMYIKDFKKQLETFYYAYLSKNDLLIEATEEENKNHELTDEERDKIIKSLQMMGGIDKLTIYKQIENK